jgi:hypothetical protein
MSQATQAALEAGKGIEPNFLIEPLEGIRLLSPCP